MFILMLPLVSAYRYFSSDLTFKAENVKTLHPTAGALASPSYRGLASPYAASTHEKDVPTVTAQDTIYASDL